MDNIWGILLAYVVEDMLTIHSHDIEGGDVGYILIFVCCCLEFGAQMVLWGIYYFWMTIGDTKGRVDINCGGGRTGGRGRRKFPLLAVVQQPRIIRVLRWCRRSIQYVPCNRNTTWLWKLLRLVVGCTCCI